MSEERSAVEFVSSSPVTHVHSEIDHREYGVEVISRAYSLVMVENKSLEDAADLVKVPVAVLQDWSLRNNWAGRKAKLAEESIRVLKAQQAVLQVTERKATIEKHIKRSRALAEKAEEIAGKQITPRGIKDAVDAVGTAAAMEARATGLAEKISSSDGVAEDEERKRSPGTVWIGISAQAPAEKPAIDVTSEVKE